MYNINVIFFYNEAINMKNYANLCKSLKCKAYSDFLTT